MLGDLLCAVPAFRTLRKAFPASKITLVGLPWAKTFAERFSHYFDDFIEFPGYPGLPERKPDIVKIPQFFREIQHRKYDLALQMHGSGSFVNPLITLFSAKLTAGFYEEDDYCPDPEWFMPFPEEHEIIAYLRLMEFLGIPLQGVELEFPILHKDETELWKIPGVPQFINDPYICIHPGARLLTRRWSPKQFAAVANSLGRTGFKIVLTGGPDEVDLVEEVSQHLLFSNFNLAGKTSVGALALLLKRSQLLISNDTGVSHIAAALEVPSVIIVTGSDPQRWAPLNTQLHRTVFFEVPCRPCSYQHCPFDMMCARGVEVGDVVSHAKALLNQYARKPSIAYDSTP
jgi:ADP-heptose:LPS heptosyltransferase